MSSDRNDGTACEDGETLKGPKARCGARHDTLYVLISLVSYPDEKILFSSGYETSLCLAIDRAVF